MGRGAVVGALLVAAALAVPAASAQGADDPLVYVALGDSFTSGPLVLPHDTTWVPQDCAQSVFNYPHQVARLLAVDVFTDVSCGSATIDDFTEAQGGLPLGGTNAPQFDALRALGPAIDVVTVGIGGNDVGFVGLALGCIRLAGPPLGEPCSPAFQVDGRDLVSEEIAATAPELGDALDAIHELAPNARVFVVSYPTSLPDDGVACWPYVPVLPADMPYLVEKYKEMNGMLASTAAAHDAVSVDIYTPSIGHDACRLPGVAWVNGAVVVPPSFVAHPNQLLYDNVSPGIAAAIRAALAGPSAPAGPLDPTTTTVAVATPLAAGGGRTALPSTGAALPLAVAGAALALAALRRAGTA